MTRWWREPYPSLVSPWRVVVVPALIIFLVLYLLQPFGIARIESGKLWVTLGAACISAGVSSVFVWVLPWMFPRYYEERAWTLGKEVSGTLALLLCITVCVWFYVAWLCGVMPGVRLFFTVLFWVLILGAFPTVLFAMWNRNIRLARNLRETTELNLRLSQKPETEETPPATHGAESPFVPKAGNGGNASRHACLFGRHERNVGDGRPFFPLRRVRGQLCPPALPLPQGQPSRLQAPAPHDEADRGVGGFRAFHRPLPPGFPGQSSSGLEGGRQFARVSPQAGGVCGGGAGVEGVCQECKSVNRERLKVKSSVPISSRSSHPLPVRHMSLPSVPDIFMPDNQCVCLHRIKT